MQELTEITVLGTSSPSRGIGSYLNPFIIQLAKHVKVDLIEFKHLYPAILYKSRISVLRTLEDSIVRVVRRAYVGISYFNPISWLSAAIFIRTDILLVNWWNAFLFPSVFTVMLIHKLRKRKICTIIHNVNFHEHNRIFSLLSTVIHTMSDVLVAHGAANAHTLGSLYPKKRTITISLGVETKVIQTRELQNMARESFRIPENNLVFLFFGTIRTYKGFNILTEALDLLDQDTQVSNFTMLIAGFPWCDITKEESALDRISKNGKIQVISTLDFIRVADMQRYFHAADISLLPYTLFDAQSNVAADSLSYGVPLISSSLASLKDWFGESQIAYFAPGSAESLASKMKEILLEPTRVQQLRVEQGMRSKHLSWDNQTKYFLKALTQVVCAP